MFRVRLFLFLIAVIAGPCIYAQGENSVWTFGISSGLDFNTSPPTFFQSNNLSVEGCGSIADAAGNLLFYSNGSKVWDAGGTVMPNGTGILGNGAYPGATPGSAVQGVAIVKSPANSNQYYLFTVDAFEQISLAYPGYLRYSVIDMTLNGGDGDVIPTQKNIVLDSFTSEKMTVTKGADCYYWLLIHRRDGPVYKAFKIDASGIHAPVSSTGTWAGGLSGGQLKVSPDGTRIANSHEYGVEIGSFNGATGMVSNTGNLDSAMGFGHFGACFSPDNQKIYAGTNYQIMQFSLAAYPNIAAVNASKVVLAPAPTGFNGFGQFRNGPDGKIYVAFFSNYPYLASIGDPNNAGMACNFTMNAISLPSWALGPPDFSMGLGNDVVVLGSSSADTVFNPATDTLLCFADTFHAVAPAGFSTYTWNDGVTDASRALTGDGTYWVYSKQNCSTEVDTFKVKFMHLKANLGTDTVICPGDSMVLNVSQAGASYRWQDNSTAATYTVMTSGSYFVKISKGPCSISDTIVIGQYEPSVTIAEGDTTICNDSEYILHAIGPDMNSYLWSNGSTQSAIAVSQAGVYVVTASNVCGTYLDSVAISTKDCACMPFLPNAFSPNGDGKNDKFMAYITCVPNSFKLSIYNRYGQRIFESTNPATGWDGSFNNELSDQGTYYYYLQYKNEIGTSIERKGDVSLIR